MLVSAGSRLGVRCETIERRCLVRVGGIRAATPLDLRWTSQPCSRPPTVIHRISTVSMASGVLAASPSTEQYHQHSPTSESDILVALRQCRTAFMILAGFAAWAYLSSGHNVSGPFASLTVSAPGPPLGGEWGPCPMQRANICQVGL